MYLKFLGEKILKFDGAAAPWEAEDSKKYKYKTV